MPTNTAALDHRLVEPRPIQGFSEVGAAAIALAEGVRRMSIGARGGQS